MFLTHISTHPTLSYSDAQGRVPLSDRPYCFYHQHVDRLNPPIYEI